VIPYGRQEITKNDIEAVVEVLNSDFLTQGTVVPKFEKKVANFCEAGFGVATNSSTSALHIACLALGLSKGDYLWTSPITFVASANCGIYCGACLDFVDIDPKTYNISPKALEEKLIKAKLEDKLPKIVIPVHLGGQSCDMEAIYELSRQYGFFIIEDASHAIGGKYKDKHIGSCKYSDIAVFSFHPVKIITTGEGGMAVTNDNLVAKKMELLRAHGISRDSNLMNKPIEGLWQYQQIDLGFNYRLTDIQAALGINQLKKLNKFINKRQEIAKRYNVALKGLPITLPFQDNNCYSSFHLYIIRVSSEESVISQKLLFEKLRQEGIGVNLHYIPVHYHPFYAEMGFKVGDFPESELYFQEAISLPIFPLLKRSQQEFIINTIKKLFN
jgi:UDP-4-amino-4,6-dideoxy-N-acetyl-beta-L-altrosamine transaminase